MTTNLATLTLGDWTHECAGTRVLLSRLPNDRLDFSPHSKSWPLGKLAAHLVNLPNWGLITLQTESLDFTAPAPPVTMPETSAELVARWDQVVAEFNVALAEANESALKADWVGLAGGHEVMRMPRIAVLRQFVLNHLIHHRAQLTLYLRLLDLPVPPLYGPTADER